MRTVKHYIEKLVKHYGHKEALVYLKEFRKERWSYDDLYSYSHRICGLFESLKIKKGDKVIIYAYNSPNWCATLLACAISGVIAVPIDFNSKPEFAATIKKKVKAKTVFSSMYKKVTSKDIIIEDLFEKVSSFEKYKCKTKIAEDDLLEIVYTSGTTSEPKGVMITNKNIASNVRSLRKVMPLDDKHVYLSVVPLSHLLEQTAGFFVPLRFGCKIVYTTSRKSSILLKAMQEENVTTIVSVPIILKNFKDKILRELEKRKLKPNKFWIKLAMKKFGKLKIFPVGGAPLDADTEQFWEKAGVLVLQGYGLTETSPMLTLNTFDDHKQGTVGKVLPDQKVEIKEGEIVCSGDNVTQGYYQNKVATKDAIKKGKFHTGDLGEFDSEGYLSIKGRKKNMILTSSGLNVYPEDIESVLNQVKGVKDSCVLGVESGKDITIVGVVLASNTGEKSILTKANEQLSSSQQMQRIVMWKEKDFPRTPSLKIKRRDVLAKISGKKEKDSDVKLSNKLYSLLADISSKKVNKVKPTSVLATDLAIDSLHRVELLTLIEDEYGVEIEEEKINEKTKVKDLEALIKQGTKEVKKMQVSKINISNAIIPLRSLCQSLMFGFLRGFYPVEVKGKENLTDEPVIYAINHTSHLDTPTTLRALPKKLRKKVCFAAAQDYFFDKKVKAFFLKIVLNIYPFSRDKAIKNSLKMTGKLIDEGRSIAIFPEGTRTTNGKMNDFKVGIGLLAANMDVPVIPVKLEGLYEMLPKGETELKKGKGVVKFGKPMKFKSYDSYIDITNKIEKEVKKL